MYSPFKEPTWIDKVYIYHHKWSLMLKTHYLWAFIVKSTETLKHIYRLENAHHDSFPCSTCFLCQWSTVTCLSLILHWLLEWERTQLECKVTSWVNHKCHKTLNCTHAVTTNSSAVSFTCSASSPLCMYNHFHVHQNVRVQTSACILLYADITFNFPPFYSNTIHHN